MAVLSLAVAVVALFSALVTNWGWGALLVGPALFVAGLVEGGFCLAFANKTAMRVMLAAALLATATVTAIVGNDAPLLRTSLRVQVTVGAATVQFQPVPIAVVGV